MPNFFEALVMTNLINSKEFFLLIESFEGKLGQMEDSILIHIIKVMEKNNILNKYILNILAHEINNRLDKKSCIKIHDILFYLTIFIEHDRLDLDLIQRLQSLFFTNIKIAHSSEMLDLIILQLNWHSKYFSKNKSKSIQKIENKNLQIEFRQYTKTIIELIICNVNSEELNLDSNVILNR